MSERILSLAALTVLELSPVEMVRCAAGAGYSHVGLRFIPATPSEPQWQALERPSVLREVRAALRDTGVKVLDVEILRLKPETVVEDFRAVLEAAASVGARYLLVAGNDPDEARLTRKLAALCWLARPLGLSCYLEPMPWTDARDLRQAARIVEAAGQDNAGVLIDPIHFDRGGNVAADIAALDPKRLAYLQFCDAPAERPTTLEGLLFQGRAERLLPGEGGLDLAGILRGMPADAPLSLEIPMQELARRMPAVERARRVREATLRFLDGLRDARA